MQTNKKDVNTHARRQHISKQIHINTDINRSRSVTIIHGNVNKSMNVVIHINEDVTTNTDTHIPTILILIHIYVHVEKSK